MVQFCSGSVITEEKTLVTCCLKNYQCYIYDHQDNDAEDKKDDEDKDDEDEDEDKDDDN